MSAINYSKSKMYAYFSLYAYEDQDLFGTSPIGGYLNSYQLYAAVSDSVLSEEKLSSKIDTTDSKIYYQSSDGFQCNIYIDTNTKEVMVSFAGTETAPDIITDLGITNGFSLSMGNVSNYFKDGSLSIWETIKNLMGALKLGYDSGVESSVKAEVEKSSGIDLDLYRNSLGAPKQESSLKKIMRYKTGFRY